MPEFFMTFAPKIWGHVPPALPPVSYAYATGTIGLHCGATAHRAKFILLY